MKYNDKLEYEQSMLAGTTPHSENNLKSVGPPAEVNPNKFDNVMYGYEANKQEDKHHKDTPLDKDEYGTMIKDREKIKSIQ